jgi:hypothetical protein
VAIGEDVSSEHQPVRRVNAREPPPQKTRRALGPGAEHQPDPAQDDEDIHPEIAVKQISPHEHAASVIEDDHQDRDALELVEGGQATGERLRQRQMQRERGGGAP